MDLNDLLNILIAITAYAAVIGLGVGTAWFMGQRASRRANSRSGQE